MQALAFRIALFIPIIILTLSSCLPKMDRMSIDPNTPTGSMLYLLPVVFPQLKPSSNKELKTFHFHATNSYAIITGSNAKVVVPYSTNITSMVADFYHTGTQVTVNGVEQKENETANDFSNPLIYTVHAANRTSKGYSVIVEKGLPSSKEILNYQIDNLNAKGTISGNTIQLYLPTGTDLSHITATFSHNGKTVFANGVEQIPGQTSNDLTHPLVYTVVADDVSKQDYTVLANVSPSDSKELKSFTLNGSKGQIVGNEVIVFFPTGSDVSSLSAVFVHTGKEIAVNGVVQTNGESVNNFNSPVIYSIIAQDGSKQSYTVKVSFTGGQFRIGGNIGGLLEGKSFVLQNGSEGLTLDRNGRFEFVNSIQYGSGYSISISNQPIGQTCSISNGSGVANYNISDVLVSCIVDSYSIGGQLEGLNSGTVTIQNNGGDTMQLSSNSSFVFSTKLSYGSSYGITITSQPIGQTCTVNNAIGVVSGNVSNVSVSCATSQYTVGGMVSGLGSGKSLVLQNNGADDLQITANGSFSFGTKINYGSSYNVSVKTQPGGQYCSAWSNTGIISSNITNVVISCDPYMEPKTWYVDNGDGTIYDKSTGLTWMKCMQGQNKNSNCSGIAINLQYCSVSNNSCNSSISDNPSLTLNGTGTSSLYNSCNSLNSNPIGGFAGKTNWRVPSIFELKTLIDLSGINRPSTNAFINGFFFPNTPTGFHATASAYNSSDIYIVYFLNGNVSTNPKTANGPPVRCVSSP